MLKISHLLLLALSLTLPSFMQAFHARPDDVDITVVICSYNNEKYVEENLKSLVAQDYPKWDMIYINDCSKDRTGELVKAFVAKHKLEDRSIVINNSQRKGGMANTFFAVHATHPRKVVVLYDGDDTFKDKKVLSKIAKIYRNKKVWLTYGNYEAQPKDAPGWYNDPCYEFPKEVMKNASFREYPWIAYPLRTFYAALFQRINEEDLKYKDQFFPVAWDAGMMFPMLEMASKGHIKYVKDVLYVYRVNTGANDFYLRRPLMEEVSAHIRKLPSYKPLKSLFAAR